MDKFEYLSGVPEVPLRFAYRPDRLVEVREAAELLVTSPAPGTSGRRSWYPDGQSRSCLRFNTSPVR